jgi:outer membrane protein assembly factor BamD (BamD/ComL family)
MTPGSADEIARMTERAMTEGHGQYDEAEAYFKNNQTENAIAAFESLQTSYPGSWVGRTASQRLAKLKTSR